MKCLILIDSHALIHRAYHALPPLTTKSGELINAVFGFTSILIKTVSNLKPDYIVAAFDAPEPTFRHSEYKEYKATRIKAPDDLYAQIPRVKEILAAFNIPIFEKSGFEADDIIGTVTKNLLGKNVEVLILTGDLDNLQLVSKNIKVLYAPPNSSKEQIIYDEKKVIDRFNGLKPAQMTDFKGLKGDPSDNIPGVKGIGEKTAIALLNRFKTIENIYAAIEKNKMDGISSAVLEKLLSGKNAAFFSKKLATIEQNVPIEFNLEKSAFGKFNKAKLLKLLQELGFTSLINRLFASSRETGGQGTLLPPPASVRKIKYLKVPQEIGWSELLKKTAALSEVFIGYQLNSAGNLKNLAIGGAGAVYYLETDFINLAGMLENANIKKSGHDFKPFIKALLKLKINLKGADFDSMVAAYILNPGERSYEFDKLANGELNEQISESAGNISVFQAYALMRLKPILLSRIIAAKTKKVFQEIEMPLIPILAKMEMSGIKINVTKLKLISGRIQKKLKILEKSIYKLAGEKFNVNSPQQLSDILFFKLKIGKNEVGSRLKKTSGGALSTEASELLKLRSQHKIVDFILKYRELAKLKSTYTDVLPKLADKNGRIHTTFNQAGTASGRLSSQDPNLQNIPAHSFSGDEVRKTFIAERGYKFLSVDYSQMHLRIIAALSNDKKMTEAFKRGADIHKFTAAEINNVSMDKVTPEMRFAAKALNFGIIYGMGEKSFSESAGISREKARKFIGEYLRDFSEIARYIQNLKDKAKKAGFTETLFGRRRYLPELNSPNPMLRSQAERIAVNMPIQGLEADIIKKAMINIENWILDKKYNGQIKMILQVHDQLLFEVKNGLLKEVLPKITTIMQNVLKLTVPIIIDAKIGDNWGEMKHA